ncbi:MAG: SAM-dependent methyltransferase [Alphaproteobacteria bacterium]|jgi:predicted O-methyltransferase YrrM
MAEAVSKTALYDGLSGLPPLVEQAVALSRRMGFISSCAPAQGRLLQVLAAGRDGGFIGETGTGCGVGLAWMVSAVGTSTRLISIERDQERAAACQGLFTACPNVEVLHGDWRGIITHGPFDLAVLDGGGGKGDNPPADPTELLVPGGTVVLDDMHPDLLATEFRVHPIAGAIVGTRRGTV